MLVANPSTTPATVDLHFLKPDGSEVLQPVTVPPGARRSVYVDAIAGLEGTPVATRAMSTNGVPIVVERATYWNAGGIIWAGGTNVTATPVP